MIGLAVATVPVIGWIYGNVFACVFLTLGTVGITGLGALLVFAQGNTSDHTFGGWLVFVGVAALAIIWVPYIASAGIPAFCVASGPKAA